MTQAQKQRTVQLHNVPKKTQGYLTLLNAIRFHTFSCRNTRIPSTSPDKHERRPREIFPGLEKTRLTHSSSELPKNKNPAKNSVVRENAKYFIVWRRKKMFYRCPCLPRAVSRNKEHGRPDLSLLRYRVQII